MCAFHPIHGTLAYVIAAWTGAAVDCAMRAYSLVAVAVSHPPASISLLGRWYLLVVVQSVKGA